MDQAVKGSCLCGSVAYSIAPPYLFFQYCHCTRCRKNSGSAHAANILVDVRQFAWLRGQEQVKRYEMPTAKYFCTSFCGLCGSTMPWLTKNGEKVLVPAGSLDDDPQTKPTQNIYCGSGASWYVAAHELPCFHETPR